MFTDNTLTLRNSHNQSFHVVCPLLESIVPEYSDWAKRWDVGPRTFDYLLTFILDKNVDDAEEHERLTAKVYEGKWEMYYREVPLYRSATTPEDKLWPA